MPRVADESFIPMDRELFNGFYEHSLKYHADEAPPVLSICNSCKQTFVTEETEMYCVPCTELRKMRNSLKGQNLSKDMLTTGAKVMSNKRMQEFRREAGKHRLREKLAALRAKNKNQK